MAAVLDAVRLGVGMGGIPGWTAYLHGDSMRTFKNTLDEIISDGGCFCKDDLPAYKLACEAEAMYLALKSAISYRPTVHTAVLNSDDINRITEIIARVEKAGWR